MSFEINIISVAQQIASVYNSDSSILLRDEISCDEVMRYAKIWPVFSSTNGILYNVVTEMEPGFFSSFSICDSDFQADTPQGVFGAIPQYAIQNLTPLIIHNEYINDLEAIISLLIEESPSKTILFQSRYEDGDFEVIQGTFKQQRFLELLKQHKIMFNVCYSITMD